DSRHLALSRSLWDTHLQSTAFLEVISSDGSERKSLLSSPVLGPVVAWLPGNRLVYTLQEPDPNRGDNNAWLLQMDASLNTSGNPLRLTRGHGWISGMTATSDGKRLSLLRSTWSGHVFLARLSSDQNRILGLRRLTLEESQDLPTAWTPDSKAVLFNSDRNGHSEIFKQAVNETQPQLLVSSANNSILPRLTPLGNEVIYQSVVRDAPPNTEVSVMAVPLRGGVPHKIVSMPGIGNVECARHPADVCVLHAGTGNRRTFFRLNLKSGETSELMHVDGEATVNWGLSPDGSRLVVAPYSPDNNILDLYSMASGQSARIAIKGGNGIATVDWASDSKSLFVGTMDRTGHIALLHVTLDGTAHTLREGVSPALCGCPYWAIQSPDGKWAAIKQPDGSSNVWTLQDFY
ncbi:MAG TPA: hypothetical protein VFB00_06405, partial [Terriglobales bacterium]|nr:hypothetical protein [Terriglobales bacterium]